jgi:hypothetical protein
MIRFRNSLPFVALLVGASMLGAPTQARAAFSVEVLVDGNVQSGVTVLSNIYSYTGSLFSVSGSLLESDINGALITVGDNAQVTTTFSSGTHTIQILATYQGFTIPNTTPVTLTSSTAGGTLGGNNTGTMTVGAQYYGVLSSTNGQFVLPTGSNNTPVMTGNGSVAGVNTAPLPFTPSTSAASVASATPFSLTSDMMYTVAASGDINGDTIGVSVSTSANAVPAPPGLVLALSSLPCLGLGQWLRRRKKVA